MGSVMMEENVVSAAGTTYRLEEREICRLIRDAGWIPAQRDQYYHVLKRHDGPDSPDLRPRANPPMRNVKSKSTRIMSVRHRGWMMVSRRACGGSCRSWAMHRRAVWVDRNEAIREEIPSRGNDEAPDVHPGLHFDGLEITG